MVTMGGSARAMDQLGVAMSHTFDRRSFLAGGVALGAGAVILGSGARSGPAPPSPTARASTASPRPSPSGADRSSWASTPRKAASTRPRPAGTRVGSSTAEPSSIPLPSSPATGKVQPYLAQSITPNADYTAWTITLRSGIVFHDGTPLNADALHLNLTKQAASPLVGPAFAALIEGSAVTGPLTVTITMKAPWVPFDYYLAQGQTGYVAAPSMLNNPNGTTHPVGTGPFIFKEWIPNSHFTATANPHYWRPGLPYLSQITFKPIIEPTSRTDALESGTIDIMHTNSPSTILPFRGNKKYVLRRQQRRDDRAAHRELPHAQHLDAAVQQQDAARGHGQGRQCQAVLARSSTWASTRRCHGLFLPGSPYYSKTAYPAYDPNGCEAKLVKQVAQETGKPVAFTLNATNDPEVERAAQYVKQQYANMGITVNINIMAQSALINDALAGTYQANTWRQFGAVDPDLNYVWWSTTTTSPPSAGPQHGPQLGPTDSGCAHDRAGPRATRPNGSRPTSRSTSTWPQDLPYIFTDRTTWAVIANPMCRTSTTPRPPAARRPSASTRA